MIDGVSVLTPCIQVRESVILRVEAIEASLSKHKKLIEWSKTLSLQWKAQLKAYLGRNGMVQVYDCVKSEETSETESGSVSWKLVGLGYGVREYGIVKEPFDMEDYTPGHLPEWRSM